MEEYDQKKYEERRELLGGVYDRLMARLENSRLGDGSVVDWKRELSEPEHTAYLAIQYVSVCVVDGVCEFMQQRTHVDEWKSALRRLGPIGETECARMDWAHDLNQRHIRAEIDGEDDECFEKIDEERQKRSGVDAFGLDAAVVRYLKEHSIL